ncbi:MAG: response regulator [Wenzhouxiangellaceae bacterium]|nr:MAG: response regulator [Wenzhouxiangellaceae bacterium]
MDAMTHTETNSRARILFVDDSRVMRLCAQKILGDQFELLPADSAESAWEILLADDSIELVFTDLQMPGKSGFDLLKDIRQSASTSLSELPVVLITGAEDREDKRREALLLGATDFITKPFNATELMARARAYADSGQSLRRLRLLESNHHLDQATGLGNRAYCEYRLAQAISFTRRHGQALTLMHLQLQGLSRLLDEMGSEYAGRAEQRIGQTLAARIRREDTVFRTGAESFTFLLPATSPVGAESLQERFLPDLNELGLCASGDVFDVSARFLIQPIRLDDSGDPASLIENGLAGRVGREIPSTTGADGGASVPDLEEVLRLLERGETDRIKPYLGHLRQRMQPLLKLLAEPS